MKIGDIVKLHDSGRRNGKLAGQFGLVIDLDKYGNPVINVDGKVKAFYPTQIDGVVSETR
jgi:hypothetical protein|tara:strand:+ start:282 stop:461 length:180 start_codon:yes stop_codon:yes gene_type:complete